jgi:hypothetical protein
MIQVAGTPDTCGACAPTTLPHISCYGTAPTCADGFYSDTATKLCRKSSGQGRALVGNLGYDIGITTTIILLNVP